MIEIKQIAESLMYASQVKAPKRANYEKEIKKIKITVLDTLNNRRILAQENTQEEIEKILTKKE